MIDDIDEEMRRRKIQAMFVVGETTFGNPELAYVVGGQLPRDAVYFKRAGSEPLLIVRTLDSGLARKYGKIKRIETFTEWSFEELASKHGGEDRGWPHLLAMILTEEAVRGKVVLCGHKDLAFAINLVDKLRKLGVEVIGENSPTILEIARQTKSRAEILEIHRIGLKVAKVVKAVLETLRSAKRKRGHLELNGRRATVGLVKSAISLRLAEEGLISPEGTIFAVGPSTNDPHNMGEPRGQIKEGKLIVFDIFPQAESGYWFDLTRTFVLGRADPKTRRLYNIVYEAQMDSLDFLREGVTGVEAMSRACDIIERHGFRTIRDVYTARAESLSSGFIHSLGHGVGLTIGERPYLSFLSKDPLKKNEVVTVEPGIYLPGYGGVRIEDTVVISSGGVEVLGNVEKGLELS